MDGDGPAPAGPRETARAMTYLPFPPLLPVRSREETASERERRRIKLLRLDRCLDLLEAAMESDRTVVDRRAAEMLAESAPLVAEGMALADAIEVVLLLQEAYMRPLPPLRIAPLSGRR
jgi:hypothetical protein